MKFVVSPLDSERRREALDRAFGAELDPMSL
jgi:hypothetical protein